MLTTRQGLTVLLNFALDIKHQTLGCCQAPSERGKYVHKAKQIYEIINWAMIYMQPKRHPVTQVPGYSRQRNLTWRE